MPLAAPPAPSIKTLLSLRLKPWFIVRSLSSPIPSVLSPRISVGELIVNVLTALAFCASGPSSLASLKAASL